MTSASASPMLVVGIVVSMVVAILSIAATVAIPPANIMHTHTPKHTSRGCRHSSGGKHGNHNRRNNRNARGTDGNRCDIYDNAALYKFHAQAKPPRAD